MLPKIGISMYFFENYDDFCKRKNTKSESLLLKQGFCSTREFFDTI